MMLMKHLREHIDEAIVMAKTIKGKILYATADAADKHLKLLVGLNGEEIEIRFIANEDSMTIFKEQLGINHSISKSPNELTAQEANSAGSELTDFQGRTIKITIK